MIYQAFETVNYSLELYFSVVVSAAGGFVGLDSGVRDLGDFHAVVDALEGFVGDSVEISGAHLDR